MPSTPSLADASWFASRRARRRFSLAALIAGIVLLAVGLPAVPNAWQADHGGGTPGTFVSTSNSCLGPLCYTEGEWKANDGSSRYPDARIYRRVPVGQSVAAVAFPGSRTDRIFEPGRNGILFWGLWTVLGFGLVVVAAISYVRAITRR